ncbi:MAG TPA: QueG-associated DUF1730 domain-containing protein [Candidatus Acidoferrales bacterium]|nr:QueG-associated DUF1730 domain-containing protein [Candidatus Acidoferrales bacterium]
MSSADKTDWILERARREGFDLCGVASAEDWPELARLPEWLDRGHAGEMKYLHDARRNSIDAAMPGARSVIVCALNYNTTKPYSIEAAAGTAAAGNGDAPRGWISRYAWGDDYHEVLGAKLESLTAAIRAEFGSEVSAKWYVDTGPILERVAALHAGLGWLAKNTLLINRDLGSWLFLGVILTTLELAPTSASDVESASGAASARTAGFPRAEAQTTTRDAANLPAADLCGQCTLCIDACPTNAIVEPYLLDARKCISYLTIELRGAIPEELRAQIGRQVFGCDICQDVCPWNRNSPASEEKSFQPRENLFAPDLEWLASLNEKQFRETFRGSPIKRAKWRGLIRNACVALGNSQLNPDSPSYSRILTLLTRLAASSDALIGEHARWAIARLRG